LRSQITGEPWLLAAEGRDEKWPPPVRGAPQTSFMEVARRRRMRRRERKLETMGDTSE
jgi:hypothetical protein